jgi:hypothetical protein
MQTIIINTTASSGGTSSTCYNVHVHVHMCGVIYIFPHSFSVSCPLFSLLLMSSTTWLMCLVLGCPRVHPL